MYHYFGVCLGLIKTYHNVCLGPIGYYLTIVRSCKEEKWCRDPPYITHYDLLPYMHVTWLLWRVMWWCHNSFTFLHWCQLCWCFWKMKFFLSSLYEEWCYMNKDVHNHKISQLAAIYQDTLHNATWKLQTLACWKWLYIGRFMIIFVGKLRTNKPKWRNV